METVSVRPVSIGNPHMVRGKAGAKPGQCAMPETRMDERRRAEPVLPDTVEQGRLRPPDSAHRRDRRTGGISLRCRHPGSCDQTPSQNCSIPAAAVPTTPIFDQARSWMPIAKAGEDACSE